jgi:hypothetical protein
MSSRWVGKIFIHLSTLHRMTHFSLRDILLQQFSQTAKWLQGLDRWDLLASRHTQHLMEPSDSLQNILINKNYLIFLNILLHIVDLSPTLHSWFAGDAFVTLDGNAILAGSKATAGHWAVKSFIITVRSETFFILDFGGALKQFKVSFIARLGFWVLVVLPLAIWIWLGNCAEFCVDPHDLWLLWVSWILFLNDIVFIFRFL